MKEKNYIPLKDWDKDRSGVLVDKVYVGSRKAYEARKATGYLLECDLKAMTSEKDLADLLEHHFGGRAAKDAGHELRYAFGEEIGNLILFFVMKPRQPK